MDSIMNYITSKITNALLCITIGSILIILQSLHAEEWCSVFGLVLCIIGVGVIIDVSRSLPPMRVR